MTKNPWTTPPDTGKWLDDLHYGRETGIWNGTQAGALGVEIYKTKKGSTGWGGGTSNDSSKVICTELRRQSLFTAEDHRLCAEDARERMSDAHFRGYHAWAITAVRLMRKYSWATRFFRVLAQARVDEIAARRGQAQRSNVLGKVLIAVGEPACALLGRVASKKDYQVLYDQVSTNLK